MTVSLYNKDLLKARMGFILKLKILQPSFAPTQICVKTALQPISPLAV